MNKIEKSVHHLRKIRRPFIRASPFESEIGCALVPTPPLPTRLVPVACDNLQVANLHGSNNNPSLRQSPYLPGPGGIAYTVGFFSVARRNPRAHGPEARPRNNRGHARRSGDIAIDNRGSK